MTSNTLPGDRRWASAKRGGMTVLGKVVVPKPINLPSQRSENNGLDPAVEIVPKGTLTWGSKSSSAWGSVSPNTDGGSPSHLSGRPSSGSGTRPSTSSSDRAHDLTSNSRPASASGALTSNQTSLGSLRPRSAETRPGSSQLSRFAENAEHPGAWNISGTGEKSGVTASKNDGFSLASGDFPTLGSEKESSGNNTEPLDASSYARPGSSSGGVGRTGVSGAGVSAGENVKNGSVNSWRRDTPPYTDDGGRHGMEMWQGNPQAYPGPPQHYEAWHTGPVNNPQGGVWFRGPPPFGNPVPPGGYPMEPFPYFRPPVPAAGLPNSQPVPPPGAGPRGPYPKNGDMYRPHMPDPYIRPGMPVRPGFYPGPVGYEGYYNPSMGYGGPNEREVPYMGMPSGPHVYNRYPVQGVPEPGNPHGRSTGYGPTNSSQMGVEQPEPGHPHDNRAPYKVLLKQHDGWDRKNEEHTGGDLVTNNLEGDHPRASSWDDDWRSDSKEGERDLRKEVGEEAGFQTVNNQGIVSVPHKVKSPETGANIKAKADVSGKKLKNESSEDPIPLPAAAKDSSLIQKIEGLNAKARASDGGNESKSVSNPEHQKNKLHGSAKVNQHSSKESGGGSSLHPEKTTNVVVNPVSHEGGAHGEEMNLDVTGGAGGGSVSRRPTRGGQSRSDHNGRGGVTTQELEGRQNKPLISQPPVMVLPAVHLEASSIHVQDHRGSIEPVEHSGPRPHGKLDGQSTLPVFDRSDSHEQRAKMKELAKQRTKQLQEEEEERTKRQHAKARAKLEELNRRTQASEEESTQKVESSGVIQIVNNQVESQNQSESPMAGRRYGPPQGTKPNVVVPSRETFLPSSEVSSEAPKSGRSEPAAMPTQLQPDVVKGGNSANQENAPQVSESKASKPKRTGFKQKQPSTTEAPKTQADAIDNVSASLVVANEVVQSSGSSLPVPTNPSTETSLHPKKRNKNGRNKHRNEDKSVSASTGSKENLANVSLETSRPKSSEFQQDPSGLPVPVQTVSKHADQPSELKPTSPSEDSLGRGNSHSKTQQLRRMPRGQHNNRSGEKFHVGDSVIWAPVRTQNNKPEIADEANPNSVVDDVSLPVKSDHQGQTSSKNKRAEMERYIPKPVAKEMAQQAGNNNNNHPVVPVVNQTENDSVTQTSGKNPGPQVSERSENTGLVGKTGVSTEPRNGNNRHNKQQGKVHGSWRQRGSAESTYAQGLQDGPSYTSNVGQNVEKPIEYPVPQKPESTRVKEPEKYSDGWDDWGTSEAYVEPVSAPPVKDQGVASRGKRHASKGHNSSGNTRDHDQKRGYNDETDKNHSQSSTSDMRQLEQSGLSKENLGGERSATHWQPKPQALAASSQRRNRHNPSHNVGGSEGALANKAESNQHNWVSQPPTHDKDHDQAVSERDYAEQLQDIRHQEPKRERRTAPKGQPNQGFNPGEPVLAANVDPRQERRTHSGSHKNGSQSSHFSQSDESHGDWNYSGQHNKQHPNRERPRQNLRYEYQPVGPSYGNKSNNFDGRRDENSGTRGRGRGQNHSRRGGGNFFGQQGGGGVRVDGSYE